MLPHLKWQWNWQWQLENDFTDFISETYHLRHLLSPSGDLVVKLVRAIRGNPSKNAKKYQKCPQSVPRNPNNALKCTRHCQNWTNHEKLSTWKQFYVHTTFVPKAQMPTSLEAYLWWSSQYIWVQITSFRSLRPLCSKHYTWPFVAIYVPDVHGDIPPSLMVL